MTKRDVFVSFLVLFLGIAVLFPIQLHSEIYKYIEKDGTIHFVDDESKIPDEYRDQVTVYQDKSEGLSEQEKSIIQERESKELEDLRKREMEEKKRREEQIAQEKYFRSLMTEVIIESNHVLVPVTLGYRGREVEALLLLDTGAEVIALHQEIADQLNIKESKSVAIRVVGGKAIKARLAKLDYVTVGPHEKAGIHTLIIGHKGPSVTHDGLLGMNFLRGLEYSIDFENQVIKWNP